MIDDLTLCKTGDADDYAYIQFFSTWSYAKLRNKIERLQLAGVQSRNPTSAFIFPNFDVDKLCLCQTVLHLQSSPPNIRAGNAWYLLLPSRNVLFQKVLKDIK